MNSLRKWLYRPRRDDKSLLAKFWFADDNLNQVAAELDSFDGRKDPERCAALVSRLRSCQDKLLNICNKMLDELDGLGRRASREFRQKFPDEIVTDNLGGQLWFGAECLAAGSSIMNKEFESEQMRPLAKAVTKTLEKVRSHLREQCLSPTPHYTEDIHENLKIFDRLFAEFEFSYVSCMVHVKTVKEFEIQQDVICLFSDTLERAIKKEMISQDMVDLYDPSLMFAIPRLAIVCGLIVYPTGPLNVDRDSSDFPELFRPFRNLLRKIRDLLRTLTPSEFHVLEKLLCQLEEPNDLERKLKAAQTELEEQNKLAESVDQAAKLDAKLAGEDKSTDVCDNEMSVSIVGEILSELVNNAVEKDDKLNKEQVTSDVVDNEQVGGKTAESLSNNGEQCNSSEQLVRDQSDSVTRAVVEIDCSSPEITVARRRNKEETGGEERRRSRLRAVTSEDSQVTSHKGSRSGLKRKSAKKYSSKSGKDVRARFKSSEDLIHRLYVCISGAADQLQTNFAGDFRSILKFVFIMNSTPDDDDEEETGGDDKSQESLSMLSDEFEDLSMDRSEEEQNNHTVMPSVDNVIISSPGNSDSYERGEDALMNETEQSFLRNFSPLGGESISQSRVVDTRYMSTSPPAGLASMPVYASNIDYHLGNVQDSVVLGGDEGHGESYYQPEPTLLTIASGTVPPREEQEQGRSRRVEPPPAWIPDSMAPLCMGCGVTFSMVRRRHHCRSCGRVFCAKCSPNQVPLPRYGIQKAVRVCNRCYIYYMNPYEERTAHAYHVYSGTGHGNWEYSGMVS